MCLTVNVFGDNAANGRVPVEDKNRAAGGSISLRRVGSQAPTQIPAGRRPGCHSWLASRDGRRSDRDRAARWT
jgi:hypothetical protein